MIEPYFKIIKQEINIIIIFLLILKKFIKLEVPNFVNFCQEIKIIIFFRSIYKSNMLFISVI